MSAHELIVGGQRSGKSRHAECLALRWQAERAALLALLPRLQSRVVFVANEVGWGVSPLGAEVRDYVDELGRLNQDIARRCGRLTLMVAGQPWSRAVEELSDA